MKSLVFRSFPGWGITGALLINTLLFCSLPIFISNEVEKNDIESLNVVEITRLKPRPPVHEEEKKTEKREPEEPHLQPVKVTPPRIATITPDPMVMRMATPDLDIDIDLRSEIPSIGLPSVSETPPVKSSGRVGQAQAIDQSELDVIPVPSFRIEPRYPYQAKRRGIEGSVRVRFIVNLEGAVSEIEILDASPPELFDHSVKEAVASWRYSPGELSGRKVITIVTTTIDFKLEGS